MNLEKEFLRKYDPTIYDRPNTTVDVVIFTVLDQKLQALLVKRDAPPFKGRWALAGGFIDLDKDRDLEAAARRKLREKTGVKTPYLEQLGAVGGPKRDPRGWSVSVVYFALLPNEGLTLSPGQGAVEVKWAPVAGGKAADKLAFDHADILAAAMERLKNKVLYTSLPVHLMPPSFTLGELQKVYELILGAKLEHKSFRRRILGADLLEETDEFRHEAKRPARLYRLRDNPGTHFFVRNLEGVG